MDIPLSSDALDLALHPSPSTHLLAVGLISGKVQLLDLARYEEETLLERQSQSARRRRGKKRREEPDEEGEEEEEEVVEGKGKGKAEGKEKKLYEKKWTKRYNNKSCRGVEFNHDGSQLWSLSKDGTLYSLDTSTSSVVQAYPGAHAAAPSRLLPLPGDPNLIVTGDDDGVVSLWDTRLAGGSGSKEASGKGEKSKPVRSYDHHFDWITDFHYSKHLIPPKLSKEQKAKLEKEKKEADERKRKRRIKAGRGRDGSDAVSADEEEADVATPARERLVCTSGDGSLSVIDLRAGGSKSKTTSSAAGGALPPGVEVSDDQEDELLSITSVKNGTKLVVGTQLGLLSLWAPSRGLLDHIDRIPGHPASIDTLLPLDDSTILTGSSDGLIRVVQILPHKFLGVVADHGMGLPVERMKRKMGGGTIVSCGHGGEVKVTDISGLLDGSDSEDDDEESDEEEGGEEDAEALARRVGGEPDSEEDEEDEDDGDVKGTADPSQVKAHDEEDASDASDDDDDNAADDSDNDSDSDSSDSPPPPPPRKLSRKEKQRLATLSAGGPQRQEKEASDFFADL